MPYMDGEYARMADSAWYTRLMDADWKDVLPPRFRSYENGQDVTPQELRDRWAAGWRPDYGDEEPRSSAG